MRRQNTNMRRLRITTYLHRIDGKTELSALIMIGPTLGEAENNPRISHQPSIAYDTRVELEEIGRKAFADVKARAPDIGARSILRLPVS